MLARSPSAEATDAVAAEDLKSEHDHEHESDEDPVSAEDSEHHHEHDEDAVSAEDSEHDHGQEERRSQLRLSESSRARRQGQAQAAAPVDAAAPHRRLVVPDYRHNLPMSENFTCENVSTLGQIANRRASGHCPRRAFRHRVVRWLRTLLFAIWPIVETFSQFQFSDIT